MTTYIFIGVSAGVFVLLVIVLIYYVTCRHIKKKRNDNNAKTSEIDNETELPENDTAPSYAINHSKSENQTNNFQTQGNGK